MSLAVAACPCRVKSVAAFMTAVAATLAAVAMVIGCAPPPAVPPEVAMAPAPAPIATPSALIAMAPARVAATDKARRTE